MTQPRKPRAEAFPETESPETPVLPPKAAREASAKAKPQEQPEAKTEEQPEEALEETPEEKPEELIERAISRRDYTQVISPETLAEATREEVSPNVVSAVSAPALSPRQLEDAELQQHVARNPVDAHAPVWRGREPNSP